MLILTGVSPSAAAASMASSTLATGKSASFMALKLASSSESRLTVMRVRPAAFRALALAFKSRSVRGEREIDAGQFSGQHFDQPLDSSAQQRLAAGEANLFHAVAAEDLRQTHDLLEGQHFVVRQKLILAVEHFLGHAVGAAEIAAIGDRNAQVAQAAAASVHKRACRIALERRNAQVAFAYAFIRARGDLEVHSAEYRVASQKPALSRGRP